MKSVKNLSRVEAIDLFCGAGGLTYGLEQAGISVRVGVDIDPACQYPYTANNSGEFLLKSVNDLGKSELSKHFSKNSVSLLAGCAPCQTFSSYNQKANSSDERWWLLGEFGRLIEELIPDIVTMENVPGLYTQDIFQEFLTLLHRNKYRIWCKVIDCSLYGLPQQRKRLVLMGSKFDEIELLSPSKFKNDSCTVREAISTLPAIKAGEVYKGDPLHQSASLSKLNQQRIRASRPGGTWREWKKELIACCHRKTTGKTYPGVYGRMEWDKPAPTMTTQFFGFGNGRFGHPEQDRAISLREGAILQGFPRDYNFAQPGCRISKTGLGRMIGNAVPVPLGRLIGESIRTHLAGLKK